jgi:signal transduction histidine kinase
VAALLALCGGLAASGILSVWLASVELNESDLVFQKRAEAQVAALEGGLQDAEQALIAVNSLFATVGDVSRDQFHLFTQPLLQRYPYVRAFTFERVLAGADRARFEAARKAVSADFTITDLHEGTRTPAPARPNYRVIDYVEPMRGNEVIFGLDTSPVTDYNRAVAKSIASGRPVATGLFRPLANAQQRRYFSILMPVYQSASTPGTASRKGREARGFTTAVFDSDNLFSAILRNAGFPEESDIDIRIYAGDQENPRNLAFQRLGTVPSSQQRLLARSLSDRRPAHESSTFEAAGAHWRVDIATTPGALRGSRLSSWVTLVAGALISALIALHLQLLAMRNAQLARANNLLTDDIAARREAERALRRSQVELRELAAHQERVREDERKRIAREIHDDLGQNLLALRLDVTTVDARTAALDPALNARVRIVLSQIDATMKSVRAIINNLRPPVLDLGLQAALEWLAAQFHERSNIECTLNIDRAGLDAALDDEHATAIFRIVQESLSNVARHAHASKVEIGLRRDDQRLYVTVADDGIGSLAGDRRKSRSFGLVGIKERALALGGEFRIDSAPGRGTIVTFSIVTEPAAPSHGAERRNA